MRRLSSTSNRMLERTLRSLPGKGEDARSRAGGSLAELRRVVEDLDPRDLPAGKGRRVVSPSDPQRGLDAVRADTRVLDADGETAVYTSLEKAYEHLGADRDTFTSIVLMTDGENTTGAEAGDFDAFHRRLSGHQRDIPVFPVLFGDSDRAELVHIAELTGGRLFGARKGSLDGAFEEIRGCQ